MIDELLEVIQRRDYRLEYIFPKKCPCGRLAVILLHRDEYDLKHNRSNIKMWCGHIEHGGGHVFRPWKVCTKCGRKYEIEAQSCIECEKSVRAITKSEIIIEESSIELKRIGKRLKQKRLTQSQYDLKAQILGDQIAKAKQDLKSLI